MGEVVRSGVTARDVTPVHDAGLAKLVRAFLSEEERHGGQHARDVVTLPRDACPMARARVAELKGAMRPATAAEWAAFMFAACVLTQGGPSTTSLKGWCEVAADALVVVPASLLTKDRAAALARAQRFFPTPADIVAWFEAEGGLRELWRERRALEAMLAVAERPAPAPVGPLVEPGRITDAVTAVTASVTASRDARDADPAGEVRGPARRPARDEDRPPPPPARYLQRDALLEHYRRQAEQGGSDALRRAAAGRLTRVGLSHETGETA